MNYIYSVIPILLVALLIYNLDKHKEPLFLLVELFLGGLISTFLVLIITVLLKLTYKDITIINSTLPNIRLFINILITVGITEEISKWLTTYAIAYNNKEFDELYDIIVYSVLVSLGFATLENILYVTGSNNIIGTAIIRGIISIPAHAALGIIMGSFLGLAKMADLKKNKKEKRKNIIYSILIPIELHTIFDFCSVSTNKHLAIFLYIFALILIIYSVIIVIDFRERKINFKKKKEEIKAK